MPIKPTQEKTSEKIEEEVLKNWDETFKAVHEDFLSHRPKKGEPVIIPTPFPVPEKAIAILSTPFITKLSTKKRGRPKGSKNKK